MLLLVILAILAIIAKEKDSKRERDGQLITL